MIKSIIAALLQIVLKTNKQKPETFSMADSVKYINSILSLLFL